MTLAWLAAAWLAGIAVASVLGMAGWPLAIGLAAAALTLALVRRDRRLVFAAIALPVVFAGGVLRFELRDASHPADAASQYNDGVSIRLRGVLRDDPDLADTSQRFAVSVRSVQVRGEWQPASGGVLARTGLLPPYRSGDVVELEGALESPPHVDGFDYADYLAGRNVQSVMAFPRVRVVGHEDDSIARATILHVRRSLSHALAVSLPEPQASLAQGILLGQKSALPADVAADLNATNTSHLVVVSGSNVVLVSAYATIALAWLFGRRRALLLSIAAIVAYAALVGASPPVVRATIMGILLVVASLAGRPSHGITTILFAGAIMAGIDPDIGRDVSFQLTFAATAGIVCLASPIQEWLSEWVARVLRRESVPRIALWMIEPLSVTLAAIIATEPLIALNFGRVSLVAVPANMLVVPVFGPILGASLLAGLGGLVPHAHTALAAPAYYLLTYWISLARWFAALPSASKDIGNFDVWWAWTTYSAITAIAFVLLRRFGHPPLRIDSPAVPRRWSGRTLSLSAPIVVLLATAGFVLWPSSGARLRVTALDIGQGDAILIQTPSGRDILVDGGPGRAVLRGLGDELPWHDRALEMVVLTHPQADHLDGLLGVLDRYRVQRVLAGPGMESSLAYRTWLAATRAEGVAIEVAHQGGAFDLGDGVRMEVLGPDDAETNDPAINNTGAVVRISWHDVSFLLTADVEARAEQALLSDGVDLHATVLKVAHHGSKTSSTAAFLEAVQPSVSVVSSGKDNQFGHPAPQVVDRLDDFGPVYNTAYDGAVHFETDGVGLWVQGRPVIIR